MVKGQSRTSQTDPSSCPNLLRCVPVCPLCPSASYQIPGHSNPSNLPASISPITSKATPNPGHVFKPKVPAAPNKRDAKECILILGALVFSYGFVCEALSNSECFAPTMPQPQCRHKSLIMSVLYLLFHRPAVASVCDRA